MKRAGRKSYIRRTARISQGSRQQQQQQVGGVYSTSEFLPVFIFLNDCDHLECKKKKKKSIVDGLCSVMAALSRECFTWHYFTVPRFLAESHHIFPFSRSSRLSFNCNCKHLF
jgi:hypothetical protein